MSTRDHRRDDDPEVSFEGIVDLGSIPPPPPASGAVDVHRAPTAVAVMTDELMDEIRRAREEAKLVESQKTRIQPKFRVPGDATPSFTDETPTRPGKDKEGAPASPTSSEKTRRPEAPALPEPQRTSAGLAAEARTADAALPVAKTEARAAGASLTAVPTEARTAPTAATTEARAAGSDLTAARSVVPTEARTAPIAARTEGFGLTATTSATLPRPVRARAPLPPVSFAKTIPLMTTLTATVPRRARRTWPWILVLLVTLAVLAASALALRRYRAQHHFLMR